MVIEPSEDFDSGAVFEIPVDDVRLPCFVRLSGFEPEGSALGFFLGLGLVPRVISQQNQPVDIAAGYVENFRKTTTLTRSSTLAPRVLTRAFWETPKTALELNPGRFKWPTYKSAKLAQF